MHWRGVLDWQGSNPIKSTDDALCLSSGGDNDDDNDDDATTHGVYTIGARWFV